MNSFKLQSYNFKIKKTNSLGKITFRFCLRMVYQNSDFCRDIRPRMSATPKGHRRIGHIVIMNLYVFVCQISWSEFNTSKATVLEKG
mgnify:CR=1 FL=1